jgi:hypothetical protein
MWACFAITAAAREASIGALVMPVTPSEGQDAYMGMLAEPGAGGTRWRSDTAGFGCHGNQDWVEVVVAKASWPSVVPDKLSCEAEDGRKVRVRVEIEAERHEAMFVADGTLVMPRVRNASAIYEGPPPSDALVAQQGHTADLSLHCDIVAGPKLSVVVDPGAEDGVGACLLKDRFGATTRVPIRVVTVR